MSQQATIKSSTLDSRNTDQTSDTDQGGDLFSALPLADDTQADQGGDIFLPLSLADAVKAGQLSSGAAPTPPALHSGSSGSGSSGGASSTQALYLTESGEPTAISPLDIIQGGTGDCYLASAIGELAMMAPSAIQNMITSNGNGTYNVTVYQGQGPFTKVVETVGTGGNPENPGENMLQPVVGGVAEIWPLVIEEAVAAQAGGPDAGYAAIGNGGNPALAMETLTDQAAANYNLPAAGSNSVAWLQPDIAAGDMITFGSVGGGITDDAEYNVVGDHCYMFAGLTTVNGQTFVETLNPWGVGNSPPQLIPIAQMSEVFGQMSVGSVTAGNTVDLAPKVTSITSANQSGIAVFHLNWSAPVSVESGTTVSLELSNGGTATYLSGSGTTSLEFTYTLPAGKNISSLTVTGINESGQYGLNFYDLYQTTTGQDASTYLGATTQTATAVAPTNLIVTNNNANNVIVPTPDAALGAPTGLTALATSPDGNVVTYSLLNDDGGAFTISPTTGAISVENGSILESIVDPLEVAALQSEADTQSSPPVPVPVYVPVTVAAWNDGRSISATFDIKVSAPVAPTKLVDSNPAPNLVGVGAAVGTPVGITASATESDGDPITYTLSGSSAFFAINPTTGVVTATNPGGMMALGPTTYSIIVTATADGLSTSADFSVTSTPPVAPTNLVDATGATTVMVGENVAVGTYTGLFAQATESDGDPVTYSLTNSDNGAFSIFTGAIEVNTPSALTVGVDTITVGATADGLTISKNFAIDVIGNSGEYIFNADSGNDIMSGGNGYNAYTFGATFGQDVINNGNSGSSANGNIDFYGSSHEQLWFEQSGSNLVIDKLGTNDSVTVENWFSSSSTIFGQTINTPVAQVQSIGSDDGDTMANAQVAQLVQAMATYSAANSGFNPTTATAMPTNTTLQNAIAIAWGLAHAPTNLVDSNPAPNIVGIDAAVGTPVGITASATESDGDPITYSLSGSSSFFAINPTTGVVTATNPGGMMALGPTTYSAIVTATADGLSTSANFNIVSEAVTPTTPVNAIGATTVMVGADSGVGPTVGITASATESDGDPVTYGLSNSDGGAFGISNTGQVFVNSPIALTVGTDTITATATADGITTAANFNVDVIAGSSASTSFFSDTGNDSMTGGSGTNLYYFLANFGQDIVNNSYDGASPSGEINFYSGPTHEQLWLQQSGSNLIIDVLGTKSSVTVKNWFNTANPAAQVASIDTTDGYGLAGAQVAQLVQAMATYSSAHTGFNPTTATAMPTDTTLQAAIAAAWVA